MELHDCKAHGYSHKYVKHTCGHEYCALAWQYCPRCNGSDPANMLPGHPDYVKVEMDDTFARVIAYESSPEFKAYLTARDAWKVADAEYKASKCDVTFTALRKAHDASHAALTACRTLPEHIAAFGW